ncbi:ATP diphosphatase [Tepidamorphus gemmatus]|uniref:Nucleoside triphosphate pyrophosphohydrolase n=1 Tax=Tepidamorphus gemmatus TaxID=747076 RepID=A0A4R3MF94_9HYPH|nr:nucleoside triphosphate pyrophosphohydrolase [Tepidamorphus gemmatus]TCT12375.1 ATP diphosphatase [Tepidamorphus gemmatus]
MTPSRDIRTLIDLMAALRTPGSGCPWDLEQSFATIAPYTIEEAYEVADAIERGDVEDLRDELGDLLLQVVFHARMAQEAGLFDFGCVVEAITAKLIRRHPHVFGPDTAVRTDAAGVKRLWDGIKAAEKAERAERSATAPEPASLLDDVPVALPALTRAVKLQKRAATVGFDWPTAGEVIAKIREEIRELEDAAKAGDRQMVEEEVGDLLFAVANLARHLSVDPETALREANAKFTRRFRHIEARAAAAETPLARLGLEEMDRLWQDAKRSENRR